MTSILFKIVDLETTGMAPPHSVIEIGTTDLSFDIETKTCEIGVPMTALFKPLEPMTADNIAIHHLTNEMLADEPRCHDAHIKAHLTAGDPMFLVAANAAFEQQWLTPELVGNKKWICTVKCASIIYPAAPSHSNQAMRYHIGLDLDPALAMPPHRAGPDSYVTAAILAEMLKTERVADLVKWTMEPRFLPRCPIGKNRGKAWADIDMGFLTWVTRTEDLDEDVRHAARLEISRREGVSHR